MLLEIYFYPLMTLLLIHHWVTKASLAEGVHRIESLEMRKARDVWIFGLKVFSCVISPSLVRWELSIFWGRAIGKMADVASGLLPALAMPYAQDAIFVIVKRE